MAYNFLREAVVLDNSPLCRYDTSDGYSSNFHVNGDVNGWDVYYNTYLYGCWNGVLFGTAFDRNTYIGRNSVFLSVPAEYYYYIKIMMKVTNNNSNKVVGGLNKGKVQWATIDDPLWNDVKSQEFNIIADGQWRYYLINVGANASWVGYVNNLRIHPFIDGWGGDQFAIKYIRIGSLDYWGCANSQCSYYLQYQHPCPGAGVRGSCEAGISKSTYTTISGMSDELIVDIDGYGECNFRLGTVSNSRGTDMARIVGNKIGSLNIGGYAFSSVSYTENDTLKITSGTTGNTSAVLIKGNAAEALGFYSGDQDVSIKIQGTTPASGFDYSASRLLTAYEINKLIDGDISNPSYFHKPDQYNVEAGRGDFNEINAASLTSDISGNLYVDPLDNRGNTLIDHSHPINNNGRIKTIYVSGIHYGNGKIKICRPHANGEYTVIASVNLPIEGSGMYTKIHTNYRVECDILVNKGDRLAIYGCDLHVGKTLNGYPDATYSRYIGEASGRFNPGKIYSYGVAGFAIYARGDRWQTNAMLEIDLGERMNIEEFNVYGKELSSYFEYNVMSCLDVTWEIELFGETHKHLVQWVLDGSYSTYTHNNYAIGTECLDDMITTPDNGKAGSALESTSGEHSYFYVTGDAEWLYGECDGKAEFCWPRFPERTFAYKYDKVQFTAKFPHGLDTDIHKSIMYFKEQNNFRGFWLSTFLGNYDSTGNDPIDPYWNLVPEFTSIALDGLVYDKTNNERVEKFLFKNPVSQRAILDPLELKSANYTDWFIIEHEFEPITCKGFRIVCSEHYSTKVTELEVYSRLPIDPSLLDNITVSFSDYGEVWRTVEFNTVSESKVTGFVGGSPRYLRLELESSTKYSLNELELLVGDQFQMEDCSDEGILLETSKGYSTNPSTTVSIENVYDKPFDLMIDLPRESYESSGLVFWSKLGSQEELESPEIGPGCILHKSEDYPIVHANAQCAIDVPGYALKNLVHNKKAYKYLYDFDWVYVGTLTSGVSVDFTNDTRRFYRLSEFSFNPSSVMYWKFEFNRKISLIDIFTYHEGIDEEIDKVYMCGLIGASNPLFEFDNSIDVDTSLSTIRSYYSDDFSGTNYDPPDPTKWSINQQCYLYGGAARLVVDASDSFAAIYGINHGVTGNFNVSLSWNVSTTGGLGWWAYFYFMATDGLCGVRWTRSYNTTGDTRSAIGYYDDDGNWHHMSSSTGDPTSGTLTFSRTDGILYLGSSYSWTFDYKGAFRFYVTLGCGTNYPTVTLNITDYVINAGEVATEVVGVKLTGANPINYLKIFNTPTYEDLEISAVRVSNTHTNDYALWDNTAYTTIDSNLWYKYFAIDLEKRHSLNIIRNYGTPLTNKLFISTDLNVEYSNSQTSNIDDVLWQESAASFEGILIHFDGTEGSNDFKDAYATKTITSIGSVYITSLIKKFGTTSAYFNGLDGYLSLDYDTDFNVGGGDFTLDFWVYVEDIVGYKAIYHTVADFHSIGILLNGDKVNYFASSNGTSWDLLVGDTGSMNGAGTIAITPNVWHHVAFVRYGDLWLGFVDGVLDLFQVIAGSVYEEVGEDRLIGVWTDAYWFNGYIDEFRFTKGIARWTEEFDPPDSPYTIYAADKTDARWIRIKQLMGDMQKRHLRKLGVYPNINQAYCLDGGYNCEWYPLNNVLTEYNTPKNVAYNADVTNTNYYFSNSYPIYAVDGIIEDYNSDKNWAFQEVSGVDPYLEIDFGDTYTINRIYLYHGLDEITGTTNKAYTISVSPTVSGSFTNVLSVTNNSSSFRDHIIDPVEARCLRITMTDYTGNRMWLENYETGEYEYFYGSYLREIEVYTYTDTGYIDSETWPVVCINLNDQFTILNHELVNKNDQDTATDWDNAEEFFRYSDSVFDDPHKVSFSDSSSDITIYYSSDSSGDRVGYLDYYFGDNVYIEEGYYNVTCQMYNASSLDEVSLRLEGPEIIDVYPINTSSSWQSVHQFVQVKTSGFYTIKGIQHISQSATWGIRYPHIYRTYGFVRWVAITRDTATNYSYDDDSDKYGTDYLSLVKTFGNIKYIPTEYHWWWTSTISTLSNNYLIVKEASRSLEISYPTSSGIDIVETKEGDDFGIDNYWSIKDALTFWLWIDDISKLDTSFGEVSFGVINDPAVAYYTWNITSFNLNTGWNKLSLPFEQADSTNPSVEDYYASVFYDKSLDYRLNGKKFKSFKLRYKGLGEAFSIYLTDIKIERNKFFDDVKFGKGLCLTGHDYLEIPLEGINLEKGTIEFWAKPYYDSYGRDVFDEWYSRNLFSLVNNNNNIIALNVRSGAWFEVAGGHVRRELDLYNEAEGNVILYNYLDINELYHVAMVWSNDGSFTDNGATLRFYINGDLIYTSREPWVVDDTKYLFIKLGGGSTQLTANQDFFGGGVFDNVKLYDYCKDSFNIHQEDITGDISYEPNTFLELSKDNINFYGLNSANLPLVFEQVPPGESKTIYLRSVKDRTFKESKKTANIIASWLTTV